LQIVNLLLGENLDNLTVEIRVGNSYPKKPESFNDLCIRRSAKITKDKSKYFRRSKRSFPGSFCVVRNTVKLGQYYAF
jgi:hypothetical protein